MNKDFSPKEIADYRGQARFLRAYYYWLLLRKYGPIPLLPNDGEMDYTAEYGDLAIPRNSYDECANYIAEEMAIAAGELETTRTNSDINRATRGAALAATCQSFTLCCQSISKWKYRNGGFNR